MPPVRSWMAKPWSRLPPDESSPEGTVTDPSTVTTVPSGSARAAPMSIGRGSCAASLALIGASAAIPALTAGVETAGTAANEAQTARRLAARQAWAGKLGMVRTMGSSFRVIPLLPWWGRAVPDARDSPARDAPTSRVRRQARGALYRFPAWLAVLALAEGMAALAA